MNPTPVERLGPFLRLLAAAGGAGMAFLSVAGIAVWRDALGAWVRDSVRDWKTLLFAPVLFIGFASIAYALLSAAWTGINKPRDDGAPTHGRAL